MKHITGTLQCGGTVRALMTPGRPDTLWGGGITLISIVVGGLLVVVLTVLAAWAMAPAVARRMIQNLLTRPMSDTLAELYLSMRSTPPADFLYSSLRSQSGQVVIRPMGSARPAHGFDDLALVPAQLARPPISETEPVDLELVIGPRAKKPVHSSMPLYLSGMAYALALTHAARVALATASGRTGIPLNSGQGPFLEEERRRCSTYVLQFGRWVWNRDPSILRQADMIEVQVGQGAMPGNAVVATPGEVAPDIKRIMGLGPKDAPTIHANLFLNSPDQPATLSEVVRFLRTETDGVPIALKMGAGQRLEEDLDVCLDAGVDAIVIDGTEGATGNAPITLSDHFGIPSLMALSRAVAHLERRGRRQDVSLLISGGFREPGDFLKALAMGADGVGIATIAMFALAHPQITETVPLLPPTDLVFYRASPKVPLDVDRAATALTNFLESCRAEMTIALRTMGHRSVRDLSERDLCALDPEIARVTRLPYAGDPVG
jgi:glutamate synthase domain-containing protein 2